MSGSQAPLEASRPTSAGDSRQRFRKPFAPRKLATPSSPSSPSAKTPVSAAATKAAARATLLVRKSETLQASQEVCHVGDEERTRDLLCFAESLLDDVRESCLRTSLAATATAPSPEGKDPRDVLKTQQRIPSLSEDDLSPQGPQSPNAEATAVTLSLTGIDSSSMGAVFHRLQSERGTLERNNLLWALKLSGYWRPESRWLDAISDRIAPNKSQLLRAEYCEIVHAYHQRHVQDVRAVFAMADVDKSGALGYQDILSLFSRLSITTSPGAIEELVWELKGSDSQSTVLESLEISVEELLQLEAEFRQRSGFAVRETERLARLFSKYISDLGGTSMEPGRLASALRWLGVSGEPECRDGQTSLWSLAGLEDTDVDMLVVQRTKLEFPDFLALVREYRFREVQRVLQAFCDSDSDCSGTIDAEELTNIFYQLGYRAASPETVEQFAKRAGKGEAELLVEEVWPIIELVWQFEGFGQADYDEAVALFRELDFEGCASLEYIDFIAAVRLMGHHCKLEEVCDLLDKFDLDDRCPLDFHDYLRLLALLRESEARKLRGAIGNQEVQPIGAAESILKAVGYSPNREELSVAVAETQREREGTELLETWEWFSFLSNYKNIIKERAKRWQGFQEHEIKKLQARFKYRSALANSEGVMALTQGQLGSFLSERWPKPWHEVKSQPRVHRLLQTLSDNGSAPINFAGCLRVARHTLDLWERQQLKRLRQAMAVTCFSHSEVDEFRLVFRNMDKDANGTVSRKEFFDLMSAVVGVSVAESDQRLKDHLEEADVDGDGKLDFAEFLRLMKLLQDEDWGSINSASASIAHREERRQARKEALRKEHAQLLASERRFSVQALKDSSAALRNSILGSVEQRSSGRAVR